MLLYTITNYCDNSFASKTFSHICVSWGGAQLQGAPFYCDTGAILEWSEYLHIYLKNFYATLWHHWRSLELLAFKQPPTDINMTE